MKSVKSLIDRRQEIEQQLHAIAMRQPPSQTVASPDGHLVIHTPSYIQDLKKHVRLKSQLALVSPSYCRKHKTQCHQGLAPR